MCIRDSVLCDQYCASVVCADADIHVAPGYEGKRAESETADLCGIQSVSYTHL